MRLLRGPYGQASGRAFACLLLCGALAAEGLSGQAPLRTELQNLTPGGTVNRDKFGDAIALDGGTLVVGAPSHYSNEVAPGSAYVFTRQGVEWSLQVRLFSLDGALGDEFGHSVALDGNTVLVGAPFSDAFGDHTGSAYVFERGTDGAWSEVAQFLPDDRAGPERFGLYVVVEGDLAAVLAPDEEGGGAIYFFGRDAEGLWTRTGKLTPDAGGSGFGDRMALRGDTLVVTNDDFGAPAVHVFVRNVDGDWYPDALLVASDPQQVAGARSISLDGGRVALGVLSFGEDRVHVFERDGVGIWSEQAVLASLTVSNGNFGAAVALRGDRLAVGASHDGPGGMAYLFTFQNGAWNERVRFMPASVGPNDNFGRAIAFDGGQLIAGAPAADGSGTSSGAAYSFSARPVAPSNGGPSAMSPVGMARKDPRP